MLSTGKLSPYIGFTDIEVEGLCRKYHQEYKKVKHWYDGYQLNGQSVYNPRAVVNLMLRGEFRSYWTATGSYEMIVPLINMDFDGLKDAMIAMLSDRKRFCGLYIYTEAGIYMGLSGIGSRIEVESECTYCISTNKRKKLSRSNQAIYRRNSIGRN